MGFTRMYKTRLPLNRCQPKIFLIILSTFLYITYIRIFRTNSINELHFNETCGYITFTGWPYGRMGIQMMALATLYSLGRHNSKRPYLKLPVQMQSVRKLAESFDFDPKMFEEYDEFGKFPVMNVRKYKSRYYEEKWMKFDCNKTISFDGFHTHLNFFVPFRKEISTMFKFKPAISKICTSKIDEILKTKSGPRKRSDCPLIGIHTRRGDKVEEGIKDSSFGPRPASEDFILRAIKKFQSRFRDQCHTFLLIGEDYEWNKRVATNLASRIKRHQHSSLLLMPPSTPEVDLCSLAACDHIIMTAGTFSFWAGFLSSGIVIYQDNGPDRLDGWRSLAPCLQGITIQQLRRMPECWPSGAHPIHMRNSCLDKPSLVDCFKEDQKVNWTLERKKFHNKIASMRQITN